MSNTEHPWGYWRPFHRINSPSYDEGRARVSGLGYRCGCRSPRDGPSDSLFGLLIRELMRTVPGWVPIEGEAEKEVEEDEE